MMKKNHKKRKKINLSIKKDMQFRIICRIFSIILIAVILSGSIFWLGSQKKVASTYKQFHVQLRNFKDMILPIALIGTITGLIGAIAFTLFYPLSLAGPLYRMEKLLQRVTKGDFSVHTLKVRPRDELQEMASQMSNMISKIRERVLSLKVCNQRLEILYSQMADALEQSNMELVKEMMSGLGEEITSAKEILDEFKV